MRLQVRRRLDDVGRGDHPAHAPTGHRVGLGDPVEHDRSVGELGYGPDDRREDRVVVRQMLVDLVGDDPDVVLERPLPDGGRLLGGVDGTGRVGGRAEQQCLRPGRAGRLELVDRDEVPLVDSGEDFDRRPPGETDRLGIGRPVRRGQQDLVTRVHDGRERLVDGLLAAVGHEHRRRRHLVPRVALGLGGDRLLQGWQAGRRRVVVVGRHPGRRHGGVDDVRRRREVRLSGAEADHGSPGRLERLGFGVDREGGGLGDRREPCGDARPDGLWDRDRGVFAHVFHLGTGSTRAGSSRRVNSRWLTSAMRSDARDQVLCAVRCAGRGGREHRRAVAQLVAHRSPKPAVASSSLACPAQCPV